MVAIRPFCAIRYNPARVENLSSVIAPPYDVISPQQQEQLYETSPFNVVRLILGKQFNTDTPDNNRYTRARQDFLNWRSDEILQRDQTPALYLVEQTVIIDGAPRTRLGFIGLLRLDANTPKSVLRHEATLAAPKQDRTQLLQAIPANLEPIFCLYPDPKATLQAVLSEYITQSPPTFRAGFNGHTLRFWMITQSEVIKTITQILSSANVLIADGHHRFEVAYANREHADAVMTYFVSSADPGLLVGPIHRLMSTRVSISLDTLRTLCQLQEVEDIASLFAWLGKQHDPGRIGFYDGHRFYAVNLKDDILESWLKAPTIAPAIAALDVSLLHHVVFPPLGVQPTEVSYTADVAAALKAVETSEASGLWLMRGIPVSEIYRIASNGILMPPKSTYFSPKIPSGLVINAFLS